MEREDVKRVLCEFLDTICEAGVSTLDSDEEISFEESGLIDSVSMLEIVSFLEDRFSVDFSRIGINPENMGSIRRIVDLVVKPAS